jgi:hypothetical protein
MKIRSIVLAALALAATSAAFAEASAPKATPARQPAPREQTVLEELAVGMRDVLRTVTPEISLPMLEIKLPAAAGR